MVLVHLIFLVIAFLVSIDNIYEPTKDKDILLSLLIVLLMIQYIAMIV